MHHLHHSGYVANVGTSSEQAQAARESQKIRACGEIPGCSSSDPAGTTMVRPLRVWCGKGDPQLRQKVVAKLFADGRSNRDVRSSPRTHSKFGRST
jgi:hypothetical protein